MLMKFISASLGMKLVPATSCELRDCSPTPERIARSKLTARSPRLNKKALAPIARPRARFSYDDLPFYVVRKKKDADRSLRAGRYARLLLPEVAFLVPGFEHRPVLDHHAQLPAKVEGSKQPLHRGRQHLGGAHLSAKLPEALLFVFIGLDCNHGETFRAGMSYMIAEYYSSISLKSRILFPCGC